MLPYSVVFIDSYQYQFILDDADVEFDCNSLYHDGRNEGKNNLLSII